MGPFLDLTDYMYTPTGLVWAIFFVTVVAYFIKMIMR